MKIFLFILSQFCLFFTCHPEAFAQANDKQNVIFIFDASGSMWGKLEKSTKIQVAKKTMGELFGKRSKLGRTLAKTKLMFCFLSSFNQGDKYICHFKAFLQFKILLSLIVFEKILDFYNFFIKYLLINF